MTMMKMLVKAGRPETVSGRVVTGGARLGRAERSVAAGGVTVGRAEISVVEVGEKPPHPAAINQRLRRVMLMIRLE
jgi:hypothetical protein